MSESSSIFFGLMLSWLLLIPTANLARAEAQRIPLLTCETDADVAEVNFLAQLTSDRGEVTELEYLPYSDSQACQDSGSDALNILALEVTDRQSDLTYFRKRLKSADEIHRLNYLYWVTHAKLELRAECRKLNFAEQCLGRTFVPLESRYGRKGVRAIKRSVRACQRPGPNSLSEVPVILVLPGAVMQYSVSNFGGEC